MTKGRTRTDLGHRGGGRPRGIRRGRFSPAVAPAAFFALMTTFIFTAAGPAARAADVFIPGCVVSTPGQLGLEEISADIGDTVTVALTAHTNAGISVFGARINYPVSLLEYEGTTAGDLTAAFEVLGGQATGPNLRIGGWSLSTYVPAGASGSLAIVSFVVIAAGTGEFALTDFTDDIASYETDCAGTVSIAPGAWGRVKARYR
jgi:hypothetical protein